MSTTKHSAENTALRDLFDQALEAIPYPDLQSTSITQGDLDVDDDEDVEYSEEHTFTAGTLLDEPLEAGGWVELRREDGEVYYHRVFRRRPAWGLAQQRCTGPSGKPRHPGPV